MNYILSHPYCTPSAILLRNAILKIKPESRILVTHRPERIRSKDTVLLRYGNSSEIVGRDFSMCDLDFIQIMSNKLILSKKLIDAGINTVQFFRGVPEENNFPLLIRTTLTSCAGKGIHLAKSLEEFNELNGSAYYWTPFIKFNSEFRVHICGDHIIKLFKKIWESEESEPEFPIRHNDNYSFKLASYENLPKLNEFISKILQVDGIGTDRFFAMDVGWDNENKKWLSIEGNSAPGLNNDTAMEYAKKILSILEEKHDEIFWTGSPQRRIKYNADGS